MSTPISTPMSTQDTVRLVLWPWLLLWVAAPMPLYIWAVVALLL